VALAAKKGIPVVNTRNFSTEAVAERALMMALNLSCKIPLLIKEGWKKNFQRYQSIELKNRCAGIIGLGQIGKTIAEKCQSLGMEVVYWSRHSRNNQLKLVSLRKLMLTADVIFVALAKNQDTKGLIGDHLIKSIQTHSIFISVAPIFSGDSSFLAYNHKLILDRVAKNKLTGYGFEDEAGGTFNNYRGNVWAEPVLAWASEESLKRNAKNWTETIIAAAHKKYPNRVN